MLSLHLLKRLILALAKIGVSLGILAWLFSRALRGEAFELLYQQYAGPGFDWACLGLAGASLFTAVVITFVRWYCLVRALDMPFTLRESMHLGFLGYLFNLAPLGIVGGDLLKAVLLARRQHGRRGEAVATVVVDRVVGLYMLFVVASVAIVSNRFEQHSDPQIRAIALGTLAITACATAGIGVLFAAGAAQATLVGWSRRRSCGGRQLSHLIEAVGMYRHKPRALCGALVLSAIVHLLTITGIHLITWGVYGSGAGGVSLLSQCAVVPLATATGVIPLMMGPMEMVLDYLYVRVFALAWGQGLVATLGYRIISLGIAAVGVLLCLGAGGEVRSALRAAEAKEDVTRPPNDEQDDVAAAAAAPRWASP